MNYLTNTGHVCNYFNVFLMMIYDVFLMMKFHNCHIFYKVRIIFDQSSALACRVESIKINSQNV